MRVATRQQSGLVEDVLRSQVPDRTNWRALLKGDAEVLDLPAIREQVFEACADGLRELQGALACRRSSRCRTPKWCR